MKVKERKRKEKKAAKITIRDVQVNIENLFESEDGMKFLKAQNLTNLSYDNTNQNGVTNLNYDNTNIIGDTNLRHDNINSIGFINLSCDNTKNIEDTNLVGDNTDNIGDTSSIESIASIIEGKSEWILRYFNPAYLSDAVCTQSHCIDCSKLHSLDCSLCHTTITVTGTNLINVLSKHLVKHKVVLDMFKDIPDEGPFACKCSSSMQNLGFFTKALFLDHLVTAHQCLSQRFQKHLKLVSSRIREKVLDEKDWKSNVKNFDLVSLYEVLMKVHINLIFITRDGKPTQETLKQLTEGLEDDWRVMLEFNKVMYGWRR